MPAAKTASTNAKLQKSREKIKEIHQASTIKEVLIEYIRVDRSYQRDPSMALVDSIVQNYDEVASELVLISDRGKRPEGGDVEGGLFIVNGQHRTLAGRKLNHESIWARVIDLSKEVDPGAIEAELRLKTNVRLGDRSLERFKAQIRAGNDESIAIVAMLAKYDTEINTTPIPDEGINCVSAIENLYRSDGYGSLLNDTLEVVKDSFGKVGGKNAQSNLLKGIAWFLEKHQKDVDHGRLTEKLGILGTGGMERRARAMQSTMGGALWVSYYRVIVDTYNEKLADKNRLEWVTRGSTTFTRTTDPATGRENQNWGGSSGGNR